MLNPGRTAERRLLRAARITLRRGDVVRGATSGGGGYGTPAERDPAAVEADVANGDVSEEAAAREYGASSV